jgi:serine/threonine-protein kinase
MSDDVTVPPRDNDDTRPVSPAAETSPHRAAVPGYELLGELGRGGMGVVYRARQVHANRDVALKMILSADHAAPSELVRFRTEAEAVARLQHPHIVAVFDVGEHAGRPYFSMELCPGGSLAGKLTDTPMSADEAARVVLKVARGVAAAHAAGVVHRDLKPHNVLLTADGDPKVADFGCAKVSGPGDKQLTATGAVIGTPSYMAPEQAGGAKLVGPAADVYALGAILYECLTGRPPFRGPTPTDVLLQVLGEDPAPPRELNADVPRDLESVVMRCLEKDPVRRYPTAAELAADLERFTLGEPVTASRTGLLEQLVGAVDRVQLQHKFASFGNLLLALAPLMLLSEVYVSVVGQTEWKDPWVMAGRGVQGLAFVLVVGLFRRWKFRPNGPAERQLWAVWGGYLLACFGFGTSTWLLVGMDMRRAFESYPGFACLTALAFFALAPTFWGYCWVIGCGFLALAFAMLLHIESASVAFGLAWAGVLLLMGLRLKSLARKSPPPV